MKKLLVFFLSFLCLLSACATRPAPSVSRVPKVSASPADVSASGPNDTQVPQANMIPLPSNTAAPDINSLKALMPDRRGFQWHYFGIAEYAMMMELKSIGQSNGVLSYNAEGKVEDMSGGAASGDFNVKISYKITPGVLNQQLKGTMALDNIYPEIELIRMPLSKGTQWVQTVKDSVGKETNLTCTITDIKTTNGRKVYSVTYKAEGSDYYETREITQGYGVTAYQRLYKYDKTSELIGYSLNSTQVKPAITTWEQWLPKLDVPYTFCGLAEYGHKGTLTKLSGTNTEAIYEYRGIYSDGSGKDDKFILHYNVDLTRGTVTEQVVTNERGKAEVNSKLHNLMILKFPLSRGEQWSQNSKLNGKNVTVLATVTQYDEAKGIVKVKYAVTGATGYYDNTYIEERTFEKGYGLTGFNNLFPGSIGINTADAKDPKKLADAIIQHSFGYSMNRIATK